MYATNPNRSWCMLSVLFTLGSLTTLGSFVTAIKLYPSPASIPSQVPVGCRAALSTDITCGPRFILASDLVREIPFNNTFLGDYCSSACSTSFSSFTTNVNTRCGNTIYDFGYNNNKTGNDLIAPLKWARDMACLTGTTSIDYCLPKIHNHTVGYCDDCTLKYFAGMLSNAAGARVINEKEFSSIISSCNVSPTKYPHLTITIPKPPPATTSGPNIACWNGQQYTVAQGDTCESIAKLNSLALDRFLYQNSIDFGCRTLNVGNSVCIRDACKTYTIQANQTCKVIASRLGFTRTELVQWNPILESNCDKLDVLKGRTVCITPPGTKSYDFTPTATWNDTWTWPDGSWVTGPTAGVPLANRSTTLSGEFSMTTETLSFVESPIPSLADYFKYCPLTDQMWDDGFDWEGLSTGCTNLLNKYCNPVLTGTPLPSTSFPPNCFPPYPTD